MKSFKQYLIEYDVKPKTIFPGYSYDEQEPETRSDEDVEKLKEWIKWHGASGKPVTFANDETLIPASEVDLLGRPTGHIHHTIVDSPKKKAKAAREARELKKRIKDQEEKQKEKQKEQERPRFGIPMDELA